MKRTDSYKVLSGEMSPTGQVRPKKFGSFKKKREEQDRKPINTAQLIAMQRKRALEEREEEDAKEAEAAVKQAKLDGFRGDKENVIEEAS